MGKKLRLHSFEHTHLGVYIIGVFTVVCILVDSFQGIMEKYHVGKKWYYLYGVLCLFSYLYIRPLIRRRIGSAQEGYLNYYAVYIVWLCSAVFYHLPKLEDMGMDLKADISVMVSIFVASVTTISLVHGLHRLAVSYDLIGPFLMPEVNKNGPLWTAIFINSASLAIACSSYFSFCGNAAVDEQGTSVIKQHICHGWFQPVPANKYPTFKAWVLYGELPRDEAQIEDRLPSESSDVVSPVLMIWMTLFSVYIVNAAADHLAAREINLLHVSQLRRTLSDSMMPTLSEKDTDFGLRSRSKSLDVSKILRGESGLFDAAVVPKTSTSRPSFNRRDLHLSSKPAFLPMVPWYCGTSADMIKMSFDLTVSVKLFLGRFDMRAMQAATSDLWTNGPHEEDGFTFFDFQSREELWMDFFADTGDGGDSTYTIARALASPFLSVRNDNMSLVEKNLVLPRSSLILLGGDLAYPNPSYDNYEYRLFGPFNDAMPSPTQDPESTPNNKASSQKREEWLKDAPQCFAIPGNHDWHDGLEVFMQYILNREWLGGWALPQEKSYFALALPHDWWLFGADLALVWDMDVYQYRYFAMVTEKYLKPESQVIVMVHEPVWMEDWLTCSPESTGPNLRALIRQHLKGRARLVLAGDLHFYMRHSLDAKQEESINSIDPDHLIIQGTGGAFLHPTHVFSGAKIPLKATDLDGKPVKAEYVCKAAYPSPDKSLLLGKDNLSRFRSRNTKFDFVGALWYFLLVWSVFPRCGCISRILEASTFMAAVVEFSECFKEALIEIFSESYVSLVALIVMYGCTFAFALRGGVGCASPSPWEMVYPLGEKMFSGFAPNHRAAALRGYKLRTGGYSMTAIMAFVHASAHLTMAIVLMLLLEMGVYTCIKHNLVGTSGYHSLFKWFESFLIRHFPDPKGVREFFTNYSFGIYPNVIKYTMAVFDIPEAVAVGRNAICSPGGGWAVLTRLQTVGYYLGMLAYYWLLASPAMGLIFGVYLYISCCYCHVHYDEAFSALRIPHFKGFSRMKIDKNGTLEIYTVAMNRVASQWTEDPQWRGPNGGLNAQDGGHRAAVPSRWIPDYQNQTNVDEMQFKLVDHLVIKKKVAR